MFITTQIFQKVSLLRALISPKKFRNPSSANFLVRGLEDFEVFGLAYTFFRYWKRVEAGLVDKELYASWLGSVNFDAISKLICGPSSRVIYALFALHTAGLQLEIFFFSVTIRCPLKVTMFHFGHRHCQKQYFWKVPWPSKY